MITKDQLTERKRGKGGTLVRIGRIERETPIGTVVRGPGTFVVKDLFARRNYNKPDEVGIGPVDRGIAFSVRLDEIEIA